MSCEGNAHTTTYKGRSGDVLSTVVVDDDGDRNVKGNGKQLTDRQGSVIERRVPHFRLDGEPEEKVDNMSG